MILFNTTSLIPKEFLRTYRLIQAMLSVAFILASMWFVYRALFPSQEFLFSFENPDTSHNTLEDPVDASGASLRKGKFSDKTVLRTYAGTIGSFSEAVIRITLEDDSPITKDPFSVSLRKSYRSFFFPEGEAVSSPPKERAFVINGTPYLFSNGTMSPFISSAAALSHFPKEVITPASEELLKTFPATENLIGFRPGALISDTEGVYAIGGDGKAHPIGNTEIFESLGFAWSDVLPVNAEDIQFHKRGKIFLADAVQPDGTLFSDKADGKSYLVKDGTKQHIIDGSASDFFKKRTTPIEVSEEALSTAASCVPVKRLLSWRPTYECTLSLDPLTPFPGGSFEISLHAEHALHAAALSVSFKTQPNRENLSIFLSQIRDRFKAVYQSR